MAELENSSVSTPSGEASVSSENQIMLPPPGKKRRSLPGMPDPESEVIALSPKSLMATNRFACEICGKGFQRDQNLQLHRRGHNLPWKLRQRASNEPVRKRVYVCPEPSCIHHNPARALGDLTGIKKHFCRKHGDKKWSCERCSKKYAVQSDWKAHSKICGSREYKCDCGTLFSRRDSFIKHRAFCDALAEESSRALAVVPPAAAAMGTTTDNNERPVGQNNVPTPPQPHTSSAGVVSPALSIQSLEMPENKNDFLPSLTSLTAATSSSSCSNNAGGTTNSVFASLFASTAAGFTQNLPFSPASVSEPTSLSLYLSDGGASSIFQSPADQDGRHYAPSPQPAISATALLQKAAQMGAAASNESVLRGFGLTMSSSSAADRQEQWSRPVKPERMTDSYSNGLGLSFPPNDLVMGHSLFSSRPATVDFLGLGVGGGGGGGSTGELSALLTSFGDSGGCFNAPAPGGQYSDGGGGGRRRSRSPERNALH